MVSITPMTITLEIGGVEQVHDVQPDGRDIRAYEAESQESFFTATSYTQLAWIGFCALRRLGRFSGSWEEFDRVCIDLVEKAEPGPVDPPVPTQPDPGDGS